MDLDKYGHADPIQRFVNKTTDEMTQDICFLMDEVTSNVSLINFEIFCYGCIKYKLRQKNCVVAWLDVHGNQTYI